MSIGVVVTGVSRRVHRLARRLWCGWCRSPVGVDPLRLTDLPRVWWGRDLPRVRWSRVSRVLQQQGGFRCPACIRRRSVARSLSWLVQALPGRSRPQSLGVFEMLTTSLSGISDPSRLCRSSPTEPVPGSAVGIVIVGSRPLAVEIEALAVPTRSRRTRPGGSPLDRDRVADVSGRVTPPHRRDHRLPMTSAQRPPRSRRLSGTSPPRGIAACYAAECCSARRSPGWVADAGESLFQVAPLVRRHVDEHAPDAIIVVVALFDRDDLNDRVQPPHLRDDQAKAATDGDP